MARKLGLGCLSIIAVLFVVGGGLLYVNFIRPARNVVVAAQSVSQIRQLDERVRNRDQFEAPTDHLLDISSVERYMGVQERISATLSERLELLEAKYAEFEEDGRDENLAELAAAWTDMMNLLVEAKEAQVAALNEQNFSVAEYRWVRSRVLHAAGYGLYGYDTAGILTAGESGGMRNVSETRSAPDANVRLVEPFSEQLEGYLALAYFGL